MPEEIIEAGLEHQVANVRDKANDLYERLVLELPREAQYVVLFGFNMRWTMGMNFREAMHMWELRTIPQGHPSYREMCQKMHTSTRQKPQYKKLADAMQHVDYNDYFWSRADSEARQRAKEAMLKEK